MSLLADIRSLLTQATAIPIVFAHQQAPRPDRPYIVLAIVSQTTAPPIFEPIDSAGHRRIVSHRVSVVEAQCFADDPLPIIDQMLLRLNGEAAMDRATTLDLAVMGPPTTQVVPVVRDGVFIEPRVVAELRIGSTSRVTDDPGWIETVEAAEQIGSVVIDHEFTITAP